jgi:hypothetical protein
MKPTEVLVAFDRYRAARNLRLEAVVIGGAALNLLGVVSRPTRDCDILLPPLPAAIVEAAGAFAAEVRRSGGTLADDWPNNGPASVADQLPPTAAELQVWLPLLEQQDANPDWPAHVRATLADVARRLGHGL